MCVCMCVCVVGALFIPIALAKFMLLYLTVQLRFVSNVDLFLFVVSPRTYMVMLLKSKWLGEFPQCLWHVWACLKVAQS